MEYIAFGEVLFEEHSSSFSSPYLFNGKELDRETNLSYYGARYLDMKTSLWLSGDKYSENDLSIGSYVYSFNNPIRFVDPDGNWPDLPSWKDVKKSYNEAKRSTSNYISFQREKIKGDLKNIKRELYNGKGWDDTVKDVKKIGSNIQKWTKDNKKGLLDIAKVLQKTGDATTTTGLVGAAAGAPFAGVGAAPGLAVATVGGYVSTAGSVLEIGVKFITEDEEAVGDAGAFVAGELAGFAINKVLPGTKGEVKQEIKEAVKAGREIIKNETNNKTKEIIKEERK
ncbi:RHS repeat domain-containing protein [Flavobacterium sp. ov086]|uniref:RHS repeat domain-containing protein n=1 Tax=Flavobacterium sp. ov086 TaxID=1761785 RepID=UPI000B753454|nr:RHS repeat-associated core domain-containing protein [Flavobacterium sp. ov086]SNR84382.1 RHS repeat-associated core domain-containing protein [Flavobacterium sp. ov086]